MHRERLKSMLQVARMLQAEVVSNISNKIYQTCSTEFSPVNVNSSTSPRGNNLTTTEDWQHFSDGACRSREEEAEIAQSGFSRMKPQKEREGGERDGNGSDDAPLPTEYFKIDGPLSSRNLGQIFIDIVRFF